MGIWENIWLSIGREFRHSLIGYRRGSGGFALIVLLMTAGTGVVTLLFQLSDEILFRPLPVRDPSNLIQIVQNRPNLGPLRIFPAEVYERLVASAASVDQVIAQSEVPVSLRIRDHVERIYALGVTDNYYSALGIAPALGRFPDPEDEQTTVLSYSLWSRVFDRDTSMIGRVVTIDGRPLTVIGVTPRGFNGTTMDRGPDLRTAQTRRDIQSQARRPNHA